MSPDQSVVEPGFEPTAQPAGEVGLVRSDSSSMSSTIDAFCRFANGINFARSDGTAYTVARAATIRTTTTATTTPAINPAEVDVISATPPEGAVGALGSAEKRRDNKIGLPVSEAEHSHTIC